MLVNAVSGSFSADLYTSSDGIVVFRAKNKNFDEAAVFTLAITDSSVAYVDQASTSVTIAGAN